MSNPVVLAVAGIFVVAGLSLIVLSFLVGRETRQKTAIEEEGGDFLDRPLTTDIADGLGGKPPVAETDGAETDVAEPDVQDEPTLEFAPPSQTAETWLSGLSAGEPSGLSGGEPSLPDASSIASAAAALDDAPDAIGDGVRDFDFRVTLGFRLLETGLLADAADQFLRATEHTDDLDAKLTLFVEIGSAFRKQRMYTQAAAAYTQATVYTDNHLLIEQLERTMQDMGDGA